MIFGSIFSSASNFAPALNAEFNRGAGAVAIGVVLCAWFWELETLACLPAPAPTDPSDKIHYGYSTLGWERNMDCCVICGRLQVDSAHIKSRGSGGSMEPNNLLPLCRLHHQRQHQLGFARMCDDYPALRSALEERGWEIREEFGIKRLRRI